MQTLNNLVLDEETHIYTLNGRRLISVTQAIDILDDRPKDPWYLLRGKWVHKATELYDQGELDEDTIDPQIRGYFDAHLNFLDDTGFKPVLIEHKMFHPKYFYAMKIDRTGMLNGDLIVLDLKSGAKAKVDELQGAAYYEGCRANKIPVRKAFDLYLKDDGTYKLEPINNPKLLLPVFLACLTITRFKEGL